MRNYSDGVTKTQAPAAESAGGGGGNQPVSWETWQRDLAFDNLEGGERSNAAANERKWYDNYVAVFNGSNAEVQRMINIQHGFESAGGGGGGGGEESTDDGKEDFLDRIDDAANATREEITPAAQGLEATTNTDRRTVTDNEAPATSLTVVVDPSSGVEYESPRAARAAGVINWVYKQNASV